MNRTKKPVRVSSASKPFRSWLCLSVVLGAALSGHWTLPLSAQDCNRNGAADAEDIARGASRDCNGNGVPDECEPLFPNDDRVDLTVGTDPVALLAVDLDGDGRLDIATANASDDTISVCLGNGDGSFQDPRLFAVGDNPLALSAADLDGDGRLDLATVNLASIDVSVHFGREDLFSMPQERGPIVGDAPRALVAADMDGDGRTDLATANEGSSDVSVLVGSEDGSFKPEQRVAVGTNPQALIAADFDGDGPLDLATANMGPSGISLLFGNGDGTFKPEQRFAAGLGYQRLVAADFDLDGRIDLALLTVHSVEVKFGNGDGTFRLEGPSFAVSNADNLVAIDLNGDEAIDIATTGGGNFSELTVLLGSASDFFLPRSYPLSSGPWNETWALVPADFDGDGTIDFAMANARSNNVNVVLVNGQSEEAWDAWWTFKVRKSFAVMDGPVALATADFDGDGRIDLATANWGSDDISVLLNQYNVDQTPPVLTCPATLAVACTSREGAVVSFSATAEDDCDASPALTYAPRPGTLFPSGTTLVTCTATNRSGKSSRCTFEVRVVCTLQRPGDCNQDGAVDIADGLCFLGFLFLGEPAALPCRSGQADDSASRTLLDWNGDRELDLSDGVALLSFLFLGGAPHVIGSECRIVEGCSQVCRGQ